MVEGLAETQTCMKGLQPWKGQMDTVRGAIPQAFLGYSQQESSFKLCVHVQMYVDGYINNNI